MAKKRGSGEGSIYKYPNGWRGQVYLGNKRVSFTGRTKTEVVKKIAEARAVHSLRHTWATRALEREH